MGWNLVKEDERYIVTDNDTLKRLVTSTTELNASHSTTGHSLSLIHISEPTRPY